MPASDERGFTLQTLIVTAVLVLVAAAAAVVIIAITTNSSDDLESQEIDIGSRCMPWEMHDQQLEARGHGGPQAHGGIQSSAIGCRRVCYLRFHPWTTRTTASSTQTTPEGYTYIWRGVTLTEYNPMPLRNVPGRSRGYAYLWFSPTEDMSHIVTDITATEPDPTYHVLPINGQITVDMDGNGPGTTSAHLGRLSVRTLDPGVGSKYLAPQEVYDSIPNPHWDFWKHSEIIIKVSPNRKYCHFFSYPQDRELVNSRAHLPD